MHHFDFVSITMAPFFLKENEFLESFFLGFPLFGETIKRGQQKLFSNQQNFTATFFGK